MLVVPVFTRSDKKQVPYTCLFLILANCLVFFFLQSQDSSIQEEAYYYYQNSGLLELEITAYEKYCNDPEGGSLSEECRQGSGKQDDLVYEMFRNEEFGERLENDKIITPGSPGYDEWRRKRTRFEGILEKVSVFRYGYSPKENNLAGMFTCMFFHGGIMHLIGNMVFLYLVGAALEVAIGPAFFLMLYLITGVCASALFGLVYPDTPGPLVGASGAISGLMGSFGVIFRLRKIRVFYSLGFYFNYAMVPALTLFPIWLVNEFFQLYFNVGSNVAYVAHIGGLISGVLIGLAYKAFLSEKIDSLFVLSEQKESVENYIAKGLTSLEKMDLINARKNFQKALSVEPANLMVIRQLYAIDKSSPTTEQYHQSAIKLLDTIKDQYPEEYLQVFEEYRSASKKPRVSIDMIERLSFLYLKNDAFQKAAPYVSLLFKKAPQSSNLPGYLLKLGDGFYRTNKVKEAKQCYHVLAKKYPASAEGITAMEKIKSYN